MPFGYILDTAWRWFADSGINIVLLLLLALLVPRAGRFAKRMAERRADSLPDPDESKSQLAIAGVGIYIVQALAFFLILVFFLGQVGFSLAGAAIPATVVSAAIGFGAQSIIADFLAGFFILTEKQYGVGDNVTFQGNGIDVTGDVIQITMRATQIRTLEQSTVSIPNSTARICINQSNYWSSAVVVIPVPLLGSNSADEAAARSEEAARRALSRSDVRPKVLGDLAVHPAVDINPPDTVGMPWTVDMRFMVRVEPLAQWMVERAIRMAVLNEFWEEYGSATTIQGTRLDHVVEHSGQLEAGARERADEAAPTEFMASARAGGEPTDTPTAVMTGIAPEDDPAAEDADGGVDADAAGHPKQPPKMAFGGTMRLSTAVLIGAFAVLLVLRGLMLDPANADSSSGWLAPPRATPSTTTSPEPTPEPTATQEATPTGQAETTGQGSPTTSERPPQPQATPTGAQTQQQAPAAPEPAPSNDQQAGQAGTDVQAPDQASTSGAATSQPANPVG